MIATALFYFLKLFQPSREAVSNISLLKISLPTRFEGIFYSDRRESFFQITQKNIETQNEWVSVFYVLEQMQFENYQQKTKQNNLCITDMSENKTNNLNNTRARYEFISFENTQRITDPSEASNKKKKLQKDLEF